MTELRPEERHEVRTALAIVRGASEMMGDSELDDEHWGEAAGLAVEGLRRLEAMDPETVLAAGSEDAASDYPQ